VLSTRNTSSSVPRSGRSPALGRVARGRFVLVQISKAIEASTHEFNEEFVCLVVFVGALPRRFHEE
jgi:hypothetical protein